MTLEELTAFVASEIGNRPIAQVQTLIESRAEYAKVEELENDPQFSPWFLLDETQTLTTVANQNYVALPTDFLREYEDGFLYDENLNLLTKDTYDILVERNKQDDGSLDTGIPTKYAIKGARVYLFPTPTAVYNLPLAYYKRTSALKSSVSTNPWLVDGSSWLLWQTIALVAEKFEHMDKAKAAMQRANVARERLIWRHEQRRADNFEGNTR